MQLIAWWKTFDAPQQATIAAALISGIVALTASLMTFLRVFLERHSSKLVARDGYRRAYRQKQLQPLIEDLTQLQDDFHLLFYDVFDDAVDGGLGRRHDRAESRLARMTDETRMVHRAGRLLEQYAILEDPVTNVTGFMGRVKQELANLDLMARGPWLIRHWGEGVMLFAKFHRSIEFLLFGTSASWGHWVTMRMYVRRRVVPQIRRWNHSSQPQELSPDE